MKEERGKHASEDVIQDSIVAFDDWLNTYAPDFCDEQRVKEAQERIAKHGGTVAYITEIREALSRAAQASEPDDKKSLIEVLRKASEDLTCGSENGTHYCPNCDRSLFDVKADIDSAIAAVRKNEQV